MLAFSFAHWLFFGLRHESLVVGPVSVPGASVVGVAGVAAAQLRATISNKKFCLLRGGLAGFLEAGDCQESRATAQGRSVTQ
jgi:hypothetical protein